MVWSGMLWGKLWEGLEELWESSGKFCIYENSRSTAPAAVMLYYILQHYYIIGIEYFAIPAHEPSSSFARSKSVTRGVRGREYCEKKQQLIHDSQKRNTRLVGLRARDVCVS